jgi:hypothetical protein
MPRLVWGITDYVPGNLPQSSRLAHPNYPHLDLMAVSRLTGGDYLGVCCIDNLETTGNIAQPHTNFRSRQHSLPLRTAMPLLCSSSLSGLPLLSMKLLLALHRLASVSSYSESHCQVSTDI